jgi:hypothetical protein
MMSLAERSSGVRAVETVLTGVGENQTKVMQKRAAKGNFLIDEPTTTFMKSTPR